MDNHEATQHEFTRRCLRFFYAEDDIAENELDALGEDLPVFAEGINHFGGYDLDKRIAALTAERDELRVLVGRVVEGLPHTNYYQYYGDTELRQLIKDCQEALK